MVASDGESKGESWSEHNKKDNFAVVMEPPAKKAETAQPTVPWKPCKVIESGKKFDVFLTKTTWLLNDCDMDPLAI